MTRSILLTLIAAMAVSFAAMTSSANAQSFDGKCRENTDAQIDDEYWIYFHTSGTHLDEEAVKRINRADSIAKARDVEQICITGQASKEGDADANSALARSRGQAVAKAFMQRGWRADQIVVKTKGEAWGFMSEWLTDDSSADRRVVVTFSY